MDFVIGFCVVIGLICAGAGLFSLYCLFDGGAALCQWVVSLVTHSKELEPHSDHGFTRPERLALQFALLGGSVVAELFQNPYRGIGFLMVATVLLPNIVLAIARTDRPFVIGAIANAGIGIYIGVSYVLHRPDAVLLVREVAGSDCPWPLALLAIDIGLALPAIVVAFFFRPGRCSFVRGSRSI